jgi:hypothetical protein
MNRLAAHIDKDDMERRDLAALIADDAVEIKQYRYSGVDNENIFEQSDPKRSLKLLRTVKGRIDRRNQIYLTRSGEMTKTVDHVFIITIYGRDVKEEDVFEHDNVMYTARFANKVGQSFTEIEAEVTK